jgi:hypothetical protein
MKCEQQTDAYEYANSGRHQTPNKKILNLCKSNEMNLLNTNPERFIVEGYCLKYPTDPGDQNIKEEDMVVRPQNHKWADYEESMEWKFISTTGLPTYETCEFCCASGPAYKQCANCTLDEYHIVYHKDFILDYQALSKKMGKPVGGPCEVL